MEADSFIHSSFRKRLFDYFDCTGKAIQTFAVEGIIPENLKLAKEKEIFLQSSPVYHDDHFKITKSVNIVRGTWYLGYKLESR